MVSASSFFNARVDWAQVGAMPALAVDSGAEEFSDDPTVGDELDEDDIFDDLEDPFASEEDIKPELSDPFEGYNRFMFGFNDKMYDYVVDPVTRGYRFLTMEDVRLAIRNVFNNLGFPIKFISSTIQMDGEKVGRSVLRFLINTLLGVGGLFDVADKDFGLSLVNEDMDQAFGHNSVATGPYVVLPFFGPSTVRHAVGRVADSFLSPAFLFSASLEVSAGLTVWENTNAYSFFLEERESIGESAIDEYESIRDFYLQFRKKLLEE